MSFVDVDIRREYRSLHRDVVTSFYTPLLSESVLYRRAVGFFSSTALICLTEGIKGLLKNGGKMEVIASPRLSDEDLAAIRDGFERRNEIIEACLLRELSEPKGRFEEARLNLLSNLIATGVLTFKIAVLESGGEVGMFHEKLGLMYDSDGNVVAFSGSMNETTNAYHLNYESVDVYTSWSSDVERVYDKQAAFSAMWGDYEPGITVLEFQNVSNEIIRRYRKTNGIDFHDFEATPVDAEYSGGEKNSHQAGLPYIPDGIELRPYQEEAIDTWVNYGYCGIFDMATGTGKTFTALAAICRLSADLAQKLAVVIVCPYQHLVEQWKEDIVCFGMHPIVCYSTSKQKDWRGRVKLQVDGFTIGVLDQVCIVTTNATFATDFMQEQIIRLKGNCLIVVDEAHNFGATRQVRTLPQHFPYRLALSATIERYGDQSGTQKLFDYFGDKCIEYTLSDAIKNKMLTPYFYHPVCVYLNGEELEKYLELSKKIGKAIASSGNGSVTAYVSEYAKMLLIKRARLVAAASGKLPALIQQMKPYINDSHILVYCGATTVNDPEYNEGSPDETDRRQIDVVVRLLQQQGMKVAKFTSEEDSIKRSELKRSFSEGRHHQALVAIRCLDEGVNIPGIRTAFILASSVNPKEYIQRRGRVLRRAPGKKYAEIYDFITLPISLNHIDDFDEDIIKTSKSLAVREVARMKDFAGLALNSFDADSLTWQIIDAYGITVEDERNLRNE